MQITRVGVEERRLLLDGLDDTGVAVTDMRYIVVQIDVRATGVVVQVLHPAANDLERLFVRDAQIVTEDAAAPPGQLARGRLDAGK